jgi:RNA polymerase sigma factor (sigma-70 family)
MMVRPLGALIRRLRRAAGPPGEGAPTDGQLLSRWVACRDEAAFELLLWRHGPMVLGTCRRLLRDDDSAEDAFQATWLVLLNKAGSVRQPEALGAWLHQVACRVAVRARARADRRARRERPECDVPAPAGLDEPSWRDLRGVLDDEIDRLPDHHRRAVVLCCLEGKSHAEAARELGCPQGTLSSWLARARARLRGRLTRRGVTLGSGGLAALTAGAAQADLSAVRGGALVRAAAEVAAGRAAPAGAVSAQAAALAEEVLRAMRMTKIKVTLATVVLVLGSAMGLLAYQGQAQQPATEPPANQTGSGAALPPGQQSTTKPPERGPGGGGLGGGAYFGKRWEYKALKRQAIEDLGHKAKDQGQLTAGLNRLGAAGWELVALDPGPNATGGSTYLFRRPARGGAGQPGVETGPAGGLRAK